MKLLKNDVVLFEGDSTTDCRRNRADKHSLAGYSKLIADSVSGAKPSDNVQFYNRGISGDTTTMLLARLRNSLDEVKPTVFSLLIGINDVWRRFDSNSPTSEEQFEQNLFGILKIAAEYTKRIIVLEPFLLPVDPNKAGYRIDLDPKIAIVRKYAALYKTAYVPLDGIFAEYSILSDPKDYSDDGVHPGDAGNRLIADEWLKRTV